MPSPGFVPVFERTSTPINKMGTTRVVDTGGVDVLEWFMYKEIDS
jgi:hypothetical protein